MPRVVDPGLYGDGPELLRDPVLLLCRVRSALLLVPPFPLLVPPLLSPPFPLLLDLVPVVVVATGLPERSLQRGEALIAHGLGNLVPAAPRLCLPQGEDVVERPEGRARQHQIGRAHV